jgi:hypothetical protein
VALFLPRTRDTPRDIIDDAEYTDHRGRVNGHITGLVVERYVPAGHGNLHGLTRIGESLDRALELPHNLGVFG